MYACICMFGFLIPRDSSVLLILWYRDSLADALWLKWPNSVHAVSVGLDLGRAALRCTCSPSPRSLKSPAVPPVPGEAAAGDPPPLPGAEQLRPSIPPAGGKGAATLPQQGISCINQLCADWAWCQVSEKLAFYLIWPLPRQSLSWQRSCVAGSLLWTCCPLHRAQWAFTKEHTAQKMQHVILTLWLVIPPLLVAATHRLLVPEQAGGAGGNSGTLLSGSISGCCHFCTRGDGGKEAACCHLSFCTSIPRASVKWEMLSCTLIYLEKDMSLNIDSLCNETNTFQTAAGLSYPLKYSCGGVTWNTFPSKMVFSFDVCANACAILSLRLP